MEKSSSGFEAGAALLFGMLLFRGTAAFSRYVPGQEQGGVQLVFGRLGRHLYEPGQILPGIQPVFNRRLDQAEDDCAALSAARRVGEEEVLPVNHKGLDTALGSVVADLQPTIPEVVDQVRPLLFQVMQRLAQRRVRCGSTRICLRQHRVQNGLCLFLTLFISHR